MQRKQLFRVNPMLDSNILVRLTIVGTLLLVGPHSNANGVLEPAACVAKYEALVSRIKGNSNRQEQGSPYKSGLAEAVAELLPQCPNHAGLRVLMANTQISLGRNITALGYATEALELEPNNAEATHLKGIILSLEGKTDESLTLLKKSLLLAPGNLSFLINYCSTLESLGRYKEAVTVCTEAIESENVPPVVFYIRGRSYQGLGQNDKAQLDYDKARDLGFSPRTMP